MRGFTAALAGVLLLALGAIAAACGAGGTDGEETAVPTLTTAPSTVARSATAPSTAAPSGTAANPALQAYFQALKAASDDAIEQGDAVTMAFEAELEESAYGDHPTLTATELD